MNPSEESSPPKQDKAAGHRQRLREKFLISDGRQLLDYELAELLLTYAIARQDVKPVAKRLIAQFGSFPGIIDAPVEQITAVSGMGPQSALLFKIVRATCIRYLSQQMKDAVYLNSPQKFQDYARMELGDSDEETLLVFYMNIHLRLIYTEKLCVGGTKSVNCYPATVAKSALRSNASSVVLCHNHPSGDVKPSRDDNRVTFMIKNALSAVEIALLDHIIVSKFNSYSYREHINDLGMRECLSTLSPNGVPL